MAVRFRLIAGTTLYIWVAPSGCSLVGKFSKAFDLVVGNKAKPLFNT